MKITINTRKISPMIGKITHQPLLPSNIASFLDSPPPLLASRPHRQCGSTTRAGDAADHQIRRYVADLPDGRVKRP
jgi:hypothetical protein